MRRELLRSPAFARALRAWLKSRPGAAEAIEATLQQLSQEAYHPSLRTHKLRGSLAGCWACSAGYDLRIVFEFVHHDGSEAILLLALGTHDQVY
ncbi:MAG: type II toxin-antitoxin system RelE/ParE family toxin [Isosphaeraceae bacterium]